MASLLILILFHNNIKLSSNIAIFSGCLTKITNKETYCKLRRKNQIFQNIRI